MPRWTRWLSQPRIVTVATLAAIVLSLPALSVGLLMDDYAQRMIQLRVDGTPVEPLAVFAAMPGDPEINRQYMDLGILPWWSVPDFRLAFSRPLSAISMWIDYRLWPDAPWLMHAHSLLWLGAMVAAAGLAFRHLLRPEWVAGLAVVLFALDDAHSMPATWLANRNALIATAMGLLALLAHVRWRRSGQTSWGVASAVCLALGLISGETALGAAGYLAAYAFTLEEAPVGRRLGSLLPMGAVVLVWAVSYRLLDLGSHGSGLYVDPGDGLVSFATAVVRRAPILVLGQWSPVPAEASMMVGSRDALVLSLAGWALVALLAVVFAPLLRRDRTARFLAGGMVLALLPATATFPANRLLTFVGFGAMGLVALFLAALREQPRLLEKAVAVFLVVTHLVLGPLFKPAMAYGMKVYGKPLEIATDSVLLMPDLAGQDLLVVSSPDYLTYTSFLPPMLHARGRALPERAMGLLAGAVEAEVSRADPNTLRVELRGELFDDKLGRLFRSARYPLRAGDVITLPRMRVEVVSADGEGQPTEVLFRFPVPLEDPSLRWIRWEGRGFVPFTPPALGETVVVPAPPDAMSLSFPRLGVSSRNG